MAVQVDVEEPGPGAPCPRGREGGHGRTAPAARAAGDGGRPDGPQCVQGPALGRPGRVGGPHLLHGAVRAAGVAGSVEPDHGRSRLHSPPKKPQHERKPKRTASSAFSANSQHAGPGPSRGPGARSRRSKGRCECARWWHWVGVSGSERLMPVHGVGCGQVGCHEVTKRLLSSTWHAVDRLPWERQLTVAKHRNGPTARSPSPSAYGRSSSRVCPLAAAPGRARSAP